MRKIVFALLGASAMMLINAEIASAISCSEQGSRCQGIAVRPEKKTACVAEIMRCVARCKKGQAWFVGAGSGNRYPVDSCN
jgi:hypothetical protein